MKGILKQVEGLKMSRLLINEYTIPISITLAEKVGVYEAIFLQQLHYWLQDSHHIHDGHKWVYNTYQDWHKQMPFLSINQIRRIVRELEKSNLILTGNFNRLKLDKTKWYRINYEAVEQLCQDTNTQQLFIESCNNETCPQKEDTDEQTRQSQKNNSRGQETQSEHTQKTPRSNSGNRTIPKTTTETTSKKMIDEDEYACAVNPFQFFEENGFGTVGGYLAEKIMAWCEDLSTELVVEAMKLAVEFGCKHWKYVEAILKQWADKGYQSVKDVQAARLHFEEKRSKKSGRKFEKQGRDIPQFSEMDFSLGEDE